MPSRLPLLSKSGCFEVIKKERTVLTFLLSTTSSLGTEFIVPTLTRPCSLCSKGILSYDPSYFLPGSLCYFIGSC
jgi:hypothetical protein